MAQRESGAAAHAAGSGGAGESIEAVGEALAQLRGDEEHLDGEDAASEALLAALMRVASPPRRRGLAPDESERGAIGAGLASILADGASSLASNLVAAVFERRFGWSERPQALLVAPPSSLAAAKVRINARYDAILAALREVDATPQAAAALRRAAENCERRPVAREQCLRLAFDWLLQHGAAARLEACWPEVVLLVTVGLTDVWSAVRAKCCAKLSQLADRLAPSQRASLADALLSVARTFDAPWQKIEGAVAGLGVLIGATPPPEVLGGSAPPQLLSVVEPVLRRALAHPQPAVRERAVEAFAALALQLSPADAARALASTASQLTDPGLDDFEVEGLVRAAHALIAVGTARVPPADFWRVAADPLLSLLAHRASTVRQRACDALSCFPARRLWQAVASGWPRVLAAAVPPTLARDQDAPALLSDAVAGAGAVLPPLLVLERPAAAVRASAEAWEWREGRLLVYDAIAERLVADSIAGEPTRLSEPVASVADDALIAPPIAPEASVSFGVLWEAAWWHAVAASIDTVWELRRMASQLLPRLARLRVVAEASSVPQTALAHLRIASPLAHASGLLLLSHSVRAAEGTPAAGSLRQPQGDANSASGTEETAPLAPAHRAALHAALDQVSVNVNSALDTAARMWHIPLLPLLAAEAAALMGRSQVFNAVWAETAQRARSDSAWARTEAWLLSRTLPLLPQLVRVLGDDAVRAFASSIGGFAPASKLVSTLLSTLAGALALRPQLAPASSLALCTALSRALLAAEAAGDANSARICMRALDLCVECSEDAKDASASIIAMIRPLLPALTITVSAAPRALPSPSKLQRRSPSNLSSLAFLQVLSNDVCPSPPAPPDALAAAAAARGLGVSVLSPSGALRFAAQPSPSQWSGPRGGEAKQEEAQDLAAGGRGKENLLGSVDGEEDGGDGGEWDDWDDEDQSESISVPDAESAAALQGELEAWAAGFRARHAPS